MRTPIDEGSGRFTRRQALKQLGLIVLVEGTAMAATRQTQPAEGWQLEGNAAEAYEKYLVPAMMGRWAEQLVARVEIAPGEHVLDVGCGTGIVARTAAPRVGAAGRVAGLDLNEQMLEVARTAGAGLRPAIEWRQGNATALPFADGSFDAVLSQQMIQFVSEPSAALREMRRVLRPRGRAGLNVCRPIVHSPAYVLLADALARHVGPQAGAGMRSPFSAWTTAELHGLVAGAGFRDVRVSIEVASVRYPSPSEFLRREAACSPLSGPVGALAPTARAALVRELEDTLRPHLDDQGLVSPLEIYVATGRL
jgi:ubiquinone/menaquinone biosynthesis C-methylase UbiE